MLLVKIFTLHLFLTLHCANGIRTIMVIDRLEMCNQTRDNAVIFNYGNIMYPPNRSAVITAGITVTRDLRVNPHILAELTRCMSQQALDTCEPFTVLNPLNTCSILHLPNMAWTDLVNSVRPPVRCPIRKGEYIIKDATYNTDLFIFFSFDNYYWRTKVILFEGREFVAVCADFKIVRQLVQHDDIVLNILYYLYCHGFIWQNDK